MPFLHLFLVLLTIGIWGFNFVVVKYALQEISPLLLCSLRFFLTSFPLVLFIRKPEAPFQMVLLYGIIMFAVQFALVFFAIYAGLTPGLASILLQLQAFFSILLSVILLGENLRIWNVIGGSVAFLGVLIVCLNMGGEVTWLGLFFVLLAAIFWSVGSVIVKKLKGINTFSLVIWASFVAWPPLLIASFILEGNFQIFSYVKNMSHISLLSVLYIAYLSTVFAFAVWNWLLQKHPISLVSPFTLLVPLVAMASSSLFLGEILHSWKIGAGILVISGLMINLAGTKLGSSRISAQPQIHLKNRDG